MERKIVWVVNQYSLVDGFSGLLLEPIRVFLTEKAADEFALRKNPQHPNGFEYICPSEGTKEFRSYGVEPIVFEEI